MGLFDIFKKIAPKEETAQKAAPAPEEAKASKKSGLVQNTTFSVVGTSYHMDSFNQVLKQVARLNPDFKKDKRALRKEGKEGVTIYEYLFTNAPAELVPEPDNEFDSNAVRVDVNGLCVGYIKKGACSRVKNLLKNKEIISIEAKFFGGKSKYFLDDRDFKDSTNFGCNVTIKYL